MIFPYIPEKRLFDILKEIELRNCLFACIYSDPGMNKCLYVY